MTLTLEGILNEGRLIEDAVQQAPSVLVNKTCYETLQVLRIYREIPYVVVCDNKEQPIGLIMRDSFFLKMNSPAGIDFLYREPVTKLMKQIPLIMELDQLSQNPSSLSRHSLIVVTKQGKYAGVLAAEASE